MFEIKIDQGDLRKYIRALERIEKVATKQVEDEQQMRSAIDYQQLLTQNIITGKFSGTYAPYNPDYAKWKRKRVHLFPGWWILSGSLLGSLIIKRIGDSWYSGVRPGAVGEDGRPIVVYGAAGEFPTVRPKQPARPVFGPTLNEYAENPEGWQKRADETLRRVENAWR